MLKKLSRLFVVDDGKSEPEKTSSAKNEPSIEELEKSLKEESTTNTPKPKELNTEISSSKSKSSTVKSTKNSANPDEKPDSKFVNVLLQAIEANNQEGFDYLEYKQSLQNLGNVDMDQKTRYQSALALAKTMGATPAKLISSAKKYIEVLDNEGAKFKKASKNQTQRQVTGKKEEIKQLEKAINSKQQQIEQLQQEIEKHKVQLNKTKSTIDDAAAKVERTTSKFLLAYNSVKNQIMSDIENMEKFLGS